ncbi:MAG: hypothetical protein HQM15_08680 [Deltaproteobacteria bacterium]|nr:hypothetical protein [Deltaproteobacteria bacterium]
MTITEEENKFRIRLLLGAQSALRGVATPSLRAITLGWDFEKRIIFVKSYFDKSICDIERDLVSAFATEIASDFYENWQLDEQVIQLDAPQKMERLKEWVYIRYEGELGPLPY